MSTATLAARARPCNVIPFPIHRARRAPAPAVDLDPFDAACQQMAEARAHLVAELGLDFVLDLERRCAEIIAEETRGGAL